MTHSLPTVAVIVLNHNGQQHLKTCFDSLLAMDYPSDRWELIVVDNGSTDSSLSFMEARAEVRLIANEKNVGFSAGCNQGASAASSADVLCFVNNDMRVDPAFLRELVAPIARGDVVATTGKIMSWNGSHINSAGGGMNFHGIGIQKGYLQDPGPEHDVEAPTLFACGGAMAIRRSVFQDVGGFDEDFFAYYEDVDLGWRLWVMGYEVLYAPKAVCQHHHASTSRAFPPESIRLIQVRNPFLSCVKNYDDENLKRVLPVATALALRRMKLVSGIGDESPFRIEAAGTRSTGKLAKLRQKARDRVHDRVPVRREGVADLLGLNDLFDNWSFWMQRRREVQLRRKRADAEILARFDDPLWCIEQDPSYAELQDGLQDFFGIDDMFRNLKTD